jgi:two-component system nitrogen regulation sensor histidine kinase GlnL
MALPGSGLIRFGRRAPAAEGPSPGELLAALPTAVLVVAADWRISYANAAAELLFNLSETAMRDKPLTSIVSMGEEDHRLTGAGDAPFALYDIELAFSGRRQRGDVMLAPLPEQPGRRAVTFHMRAPVHFTGRRADRGSGTLTAVGAAAMLAHEIKNPLSGIRGAAQLLESTVDDGAAELTRLIRDEVDRVAALIDRMEGFTDTRPLELSGQNIHAILGHARGVALQGFAQDLTIREIYDPSLPAVLGHRDSLIQVILNLMKNAAEAMREGGGSTITLRTAYRHGLSLLTHGPDGRQSLPIEVCVTDDGPGVSQEIVDHLFDPFVTTKRSGGGLGLALVEKLVSDQGGMVEYVRDGNVRGTTFRLLLPRARTRHE